MTHVAGDDVAAEHGDALRQAWEEKVEPMITAIRALDGATGLLRAVKDAGLHLVLASSD